jgi:hypothetical protein
LYKYMSMISPDARYPLIPVHRVYADPNAYLFGHTVQARRQELGISLFEAADLSGMTIWQWAAIEECLTVPTERNLLLAVAGTLEFNFFMLVLLANLSSVAQSLSEEAA